MSKSLKALLSSVFPDRCVYCDAKIPYNTSVCSECAESLPRITGKVCVKCGREKSECGCGGRENYFASIAAPFYFTGRVRQGIHRFKFRGNTSSAAEFAREMYSAMNERFAGIEFDFITTVPMSKKSLKKRGYDQCDLLAKELSSLSGVSYRPGALVKIYETESQHGLSAILRRGNLAGAFDVNEGEDVKDKTVLLCDDISTSGETLNECAKMLWLAGAKEVYCIALALTKSEKKKKTG